MTTQQAASGNRPTHRIYSVSGEGDAASWREIGAAWPNKDGKGFSINCQALPLSGRIVMRAVRKGDAA